MSNGLKIFSIIVSFAVISLLVQIAYADNQTNSTGMRIYVTNLTITRSWSSNAVESANLNYNQVPAQPNFVGLLLVMVVASLVVLLLAQMLRRMKPKSKRKRSKFSKRKSKE